MFVDIRCNCLSPTACWTADSCLKTLILSAVLGQVLNFVVSQVWFGQKYSSLDMKLLALCLLYVKCVCWVLCVWDLIKVARHRLLKRKIGISEYFRLCLRHFQTTVVCQTLLLRLVKGHCEGTLSSFSVNPRPQHCPDTPPISIGLMIWLV